MSDCKMDSLKGQRITVKFCVLVILASFHLHLNEQVVPDRCGRDWLFGRRLSGVAQILQRRGAFSILRSKSRNKT